MHKHKNSLILAQLAAILKRMAAIFDLQVDCFQSPIVIAKDDLYQVSRLYHQLNDSPKILLLSRTHPLQRPLFG